MEILGIRDGYQEQERNGLHIAHCASRQALGTSTARRTHISDICKLDVDHFFHFFFYGKGKSTRSRDVKRRNTSVSTNTHLPPLATFHIVRPISVCKLSKALPTERHFPSQQQHRYSLWRISALSHQTLSICLATFYDVNEITIPRTTAHTACLFASLKLQSNSSSAHTAHTLFYRFSRTQKPSLRLDEQTFLSIRRYLHMGVKQAPKSREMDR